MRSVYPSDISREKFEIILPDLEFCRKKKAKKTYDVFCGRPKKLLPVDHKSFQNEEVVTTTLKNGAKNQA